MKNIDIIDKSIKKLSIENSLLKDEVTELKAKVDWYEAQFRLAQKKRFGASSEKTDEHQLYFFNEAEETANPIVVEPTIETITYKRKKQVGARSEQLSGLPEEMVFYTLSEEERVCPCCQGEMHEMGKDVRKELTIIPAQAKVRSHYVSVYSCRHCQKEGITTPVIKANAPNPPIPGGIASASSISYILSQKYVEGLPLYRQEKNLKSLGIELSRQTMSNWTTYSAEKWFKPLYDHLQLELKKQDILLADETTLQVLHEDGKAAESKSYMWLYRTNHSEDRAIVLYDYQASRSGDHAKEFLDGFTGILQTDGYAGYNKVENVTRVGCFAHARRYFLETLDSLPPKQKARSQAQMGVKFCNDLFEMDRRLSNMPDEKKKDFRDKRVAEILDGFYNWLKKIELEVLPKSKFGKAITYCLNQWKYLENISVDRRLAVSNNLAERSIKPFVIGRKNWLFSNTPKGAKSSAIIYSLVETAKENGLIPHAYLKFLLEQLPNMEIKPETLAYLVPWSPYIPEECRLKKKK